MTTNYEDLLDICQQYGLYAQYYRGKWLVALGEFIGIGKTLPEAINAWCQSVEVKWKDFIA